MAALETVHVLRWVFTRSHETFRCELALDDEALVYELRVVPSHQTTSTTLETFPHVAMAFARQGDLEAALTTDGWTLSAYEAVKRTPPGEPNRRTEQI